VFLRVVSSGEVTVVGGNDRVGGSLLNIAAVPLSNARTAGVGKNHATELLEGLELTVTLNGGANLLGTGSDGEDGLGLDAVVESVLGNGSGTAHVLVRGVGARADQTDLELLGPTIGLDGILELADGGGKIGGEGTVDVRLELRKVDLDELVVLGALVLAELVGVLTGEVTDLRSFRGYKVIVHAVIEGEERGGSTNLSAHVATRWLVRAPRFKEFDIDLPHSGHSSSADGVNTRAKVLDNGTSTALDSEDTSNLEDNV
jgi:hypothetical protein